MSHELIGRIRGEFIEMPGLKLNFQQACRLWNLSASACREALDALRAEGFLYQTPSGAFIAFPSATRMLKAAPAAVPALFSSELCERCRHKRRDQLPMRGLSQVGGQRPRIRIIPFGLIGRR